MWDIVDHDGVSRVIKKLNRRKDITRLEPRKLLIDGLDAITPETTPEGEDSKRKDEDGAMYITSLFFFFSG